MIDQARILIVEDEPKWIRTFRRLLSDKDALTLNNDVAFEEAKSLSEARNLLRDNMFDVVLLDLRLTTWDMKSFEGMELLPDLAEITIKFGTQVIITSAHGTIDITRDAFKNHNIHDFFQKRNLSTEIKQFHKSVKEGIEKAQAIRSESNDTT
ncbi:hypothetical protein MNBD_CHLOROFLEXI01-5047 [hydrothermal vent metagenome]|uniref:Response regulatory domain-containing protein n=1 Tax=hydrothermal vent metagenome TaxID=652676 RepID=A0A3B0V0Q1_9ZZZZ